MIRFVLPLALFALAPVGKAQEKPRRALPVEDAPAETAGAAFAPAGTPVTSSSGQFMISGGMSGVPGTVAVIAESAKADLLRLTGEKEPEKRTPILIVLHGTPGDPLPPRTMRMSLTTVDGEATMKLDCHLARGLDAEALRYRVTEALIYQRAILAGHTGNAERNLEVPPWLAEGLREAVAWKGGQTDRKLYEALFSRGGLFRLDDLFALDDAGRDGLDGATRLAFKVSSGSLVSVLLEQPGGTGGFQTFLDEVASFQGEMPVLLRKHFPEMNLSETSLAKWWALQLANRGGQALLTQVAGVRETDKTLAQALLLHFRGEKGEILAEPVNSAWQRVIALPQGERRAAIASAQDALNRASYRSFPSFRPLIVEYQKILGDLVKGEGKSIPLRLAELEQNRATMLARANRARDYLDWFEISRARITSGAFDDYLRLKERLKSGKTRRTDPVSAYLDRMDALFGRGLPDKAPAAPEAPPFSAGLPGDLPPDVLQGNVPVPPVQPPDQLPDIPLDLPE